MGNFEARLEREYDLRRAELWAAHERGEHAVAVLDCDRCIRAKREAAEVEPDPSWTEDDEGWVRAPLSYENREGNPAFNGAFDKW